VAEFICIKRENRSFATSIFEKQISMKRSEVKHLLTEGKVGTEVLIKAWVRTKRGSKNVSFIALNDGSTIK